MIRLLIDEDLPRSMCRALRSAGFECTDVRDVGLRGAKDRKILDFAVQKSYVLVTGDLDFVRLVRLHSSKPKGLVIVRLPNQMSPANMNKRLAEALSKIHQKIYNHIVVVETNRIRIRPLPK